MKTIIDIRTTEPGKVLCDMHYGISQLENRITGFVLVSHVQLSSALGSNIVGALLGESGVEYPTVHNKLLYLLEQDNTGNYKAVYTYDGRKFGIVTFRVEKPK